MQTRTAFLVFSTTFYVLMSIAATTYAADCSLLGPGFRPALPTDSAVVNGKITAGTCYDPQSNDAINAEYEDARRFLLSRYVIGPRSAPCIKTKEQGVDGLNKDFAVRVANLMKDMEKSLGGQNVLRSAYRPAACGGGVGHSAGCAVDIEYAHAQGDKWRDSSDNPNVPEAKWIRDNGGNTKYRLHFPFPYPPEWHHVEPMDRASCLAGRAINPSVGGTQATPPSTTPTQQAMRGLQNFFTPPQPVTCAAGMTLLNGTCVPQQAVQPASNPFDYIQSPPASSTAISTMNASISAGANNTPSPSVFDRINAIANPTTTATTASAATGTSVTLNNSLKDAVVLNAGENPNAQRTGSSVSARPGVSQTFVSEDLSKATKQYSGSSASTFALLNSLRSTLLSILQVLRPFGGTMPRPAVANSGEHPPEYGY